MLYVMEWMRRAMAPRLSGEQTRDFAIAADVDILSRRRFWFSLFWTRARKKSGKGVFWISLAEGGLRLQMSIPDIALILMHNARNCYVALQEGLSS
jgi:hypothetical protein